MKTGPARIWVDRLCLGSVLRLLASGLLASASGVRFLAGSGRWVRFLRRVRPGLAVEQADVWLGDVLDRDGVNLRVGIDAECDRTLQAVAAAVLRPVIGASGLLPGVPRPWIERYGCQEIYPGLYRRVSGEAMIRTDMDRAPACEGERRVALVRGNPFEAFRPARPEPGEILSYGKWLELAGQIFFCLALPVLLPLLGLFLALAGRREAPKPAGPTVAIQYCWGHDRKRRSDLYWHDPALLAPEKVLFYFDRQDTPLTPELEDALARAGYRGLVLDRLFSLHEFLRPATFLRRAKALIRGRNEGAWLPGWRFLVPVFNQAFPLVLTLFSQSRRVGWSRSMSLLALFLQMLLGVHYWRAFFASERVLVHMNHSADCGSRHTARSMAIHMAGGANVRSSYSFLSFYDPSYSREFHAYFTWGPQPYCLPENDRIFSCRRINSGYLFDHLFRQAQRRQSRQNQLTVAVFDEVSHRESCYSWDIVREFYDGCLGLVSLDPRIRMVLKPKRYGEKELRRISGRFQAAMDTGRLSLLSNRQSPFQAAAEADICIALGPNSAGIEAALFGLPVVYWVPDRLCCGLLEGGESRLVFRSLDELLDAVRGFSPGMRNVGGHSDVLPAIDPWRDGRAGERVGGYVATLEGALASGRNVMDALEEASAGYAARWGEAHVTTIDLDALWRQHVHQ